MNSTQAVERGRPMVMWKGALVPNRIGVALNEPLRGQANLGDEAKTLLSLCFDESAHYTPPVVGDPSLEKHVRTKFVCKFDYKFTRDLAYNRINTSKMIPAILNNRNIPEDVKLVVAKRSRAAAAVEWSQIGVSRNWIVRLKSNIEELRLDRASQERLNSASQEEVRNSYPRTRVCLLSRKHAHARARSRRRRP